MGGSPVGRVAKEVGVSATRVYDLARREKLPTNSPVLEGSPKERKILKALETYTVEEVADIFGQAVCRIEEVVERLQSRAAKLAHRH
jgi:hypothetical protein